MRAAVPLFLLLSLLAAAHCGGSPSAPGGGAPVVSSITPSHGPAIGGTSVRIAGGNFTAGAAVTIGGVPVVDLVVESASAITAKTGARTAGPADVAVSVAGRSAVLAGAFTYDVVVSDPPVIVSIVARGSRANEPAGLADLDEQITVAATVQDPDTAVDQLAFEWSAAAGTFSGTGATVTWRAPADAATPATIALALTVADGANRVSGSTLVSLHNSVKEVGDLAREFLLDFSDSSKSAAVVVRNFSKSPRCEGTRDSEFDDVSDNRQRYRIESSSIGAASVTFQFAGRPCSYMPVNGDACAVIPAVWKSLCLKTNEECVAGERTTADGLDYVTAVFELSEWRLCASSFASRNGISRPHFIR